MVVSLVRKLHSTDWSGLNCCFSELFRDCAGSKLLLHKKADVEVDFILFVFTQASGIHLLLFYFFLFFFYGCRHRFNSCRDRQDIY